MHTDPWPSAEIPGKLVVAPPARWVTEVGRHAALLRAGGRWRPPFGPSTLWLASPRDTSAAERRSDRRPFTAPLSLSLTHYSPLSVGSWARRIVDVELQPVEPPCVWVRDLDVSNGWNALIICYIGVQVHKKWWKWAGPCFNSCWCSRPWFEAGVSSPSPFYPTELSMALCAQVT